MDYSINGKGMDMSDMYRPRLVVDITEEQARKLEKYLEYGMRGRVFSVVIDDVIEMIEKHGAIFLAAIIAKRLHLVDYTTLNIGDKSGNIRKSRAKKTNSSE